MSDPSHNLERFRVVLVEPQGDRNIGSVARAMMNFGFSSLYLVNPQIDHLGEEARKMAVRAAPLLERAIVCESLDAALDGCKLAVATTRRFGKYREDFIGPDQLAASLAPAGNEPVALVFGREDKGLLTSELDLCQILLTIPTRDELPSMNLASSVVLCVHALARDLAVSTVEVPEGDPLANIEELENMFAHMRSTLTEIEYLDTQNPDHILRAFRRLFGRTSLDQREVKILQGLWSRIDWLEGERRRLQNACDGKDA
ncbi:MAG: RNA methyltransferase [Desulfuromonas sp.]|nr:MAG: RNA methyltransferase [Desulfuromonas sp.]